MLRLFPLLLLTCALCACGRRDAAQTGGPAGPGGRGEVVLQVETRTIEPQPFEDRLTVTGSLQADEEVMLRPERSGIVDEIRFEEGEHVEAGRVLLRLRAEDIEAQVKRAEAQLQLATREADRQQTLGQRQAISRAELDQARSSLEVAGAEAEIARAELTKTQVRAPFDGVVGLREVSVGGYVTPTTDIASFRRLDPLKLEMNVPERYARYLRAGLPVEFSVAGAADRFQGKVYAIEPGIDPVSRTIRLRAHVQNPGGRLAPGAFVEAQLVLDRIENAILVPSLAVVPGLKEETVFVANNGRAEVRRVITGIRTADSVLIEEGLQPGEEIITSSILQLRPGVRVAPMGRRSPDTTEAPPAT